MKLFDKIKDLFTEEVPDEDVPIKKEVIQVEIPAPEVPIKKEREQVKSEPIKVQKEQEKYNFPVFFDEKDFDDIQKKEEVEPEVKPYVAPTYNPGYPSKQKKEPYGIKKEEKVEKKKFNPTPIISPVYGVLDKNYKKDDIVNNAPVTSYTEDTAITVDDVRKKAYGTLEDELENTLFGKTSIIFSANDVKQKEPKNDSYSDIEDELQNAADALDLLSDDNDENKSEDIGDNTNNINEEDSVENELSRTLTDNSTLSESDLFNLIDNMYEKSEGDK